VEGLALFCGTSEIAAVEAGGHRFRTITKAEPLVKLTTTKNCTQTGGKTVVRQRCCVVMVAPVFFDTSTRWDTSLVLVIGVEVAALPFNCASGT